MTDDARRERLRASWDANAAAWTDAVRTGALPSRRLATDAAVVAAVRARRPRRVLDVGCGEGWLVRALAEHGLEAVGVDGAAALVEAACARGGRFARMTYAELAAGARPPGAPFDAVVCNFALLDDDLGPLLGALRSLLAPGGALVVQTVHPCSAGPPYTDGWRTETFDGFGAGFTEPMPWYFRTMASWIGLLRAAGFALEHLAEPAEPTTHQPLSLLVTAVRDNAS